MLYWCGIRLGELRALTPSDFYPDCDARVTEEFVNKVSSKLKKKNVSLSHEMIVTDPSSGKYLEEYIVMADKEMYKIKQARKAK